MRFATLEIQPYVLLCHEADFDAEVSFAIIDESGNVLAKVICEPLNNDLMPRKRGAHIKLLTYCSNIPKDLISEMLKNVTNAVTFIRVAEAEYLVYKYDYLWFEHPDIPCSLLLSYYNDCEIAGDQYIYHLTRD